VAAAVPVAPAAWAAPAARRAGGGTSEKAERELEMLRKELERTNNKLDRIANALED